MDDFEKLEILKDIQHRIQGQYEILSQIDRNNKLDVFTDKMYSMTPEEVANFLIEIAGQMKEGSIEEKLNDTAEDREDIRNKMMSMSNEHKLIAYLDDYYKACSTEGYGTEYMHEAYRLLNSKLTDRIKEITDRIVLLDSKR